MIKTNVIRLLENAGIDFQPHEYDAADGEIDAVSVSKKIGVPAGQCFKTLVAENPEHEHFVFVIPGPDELDLKKAAAATGSKSIHMIPLKTLLPLTGYVHGGCSPVGMKKAFPTFLDETAILYELIGISGGKVGLNVCLNPERLAEYIGAKFVDLTVRK